MVLTKSVEKLYHKLITGNSSDNNDYLRGAFAPTEEVLYKDLPVKGTLPPDVNGMLHSVRMKDGKASYSCRYVLTSRLQQERKSNYPSFLKLGDMQGASALPLMFWYKLKASLGWINMKNGGGTANTALVYHAERLLALHEGDLPYHVRLLCEGVVETVGRLATEGMESPFTAHPKVCPVTDLTTGELVFFGYRMEGGHHITVSTADASGKVLRTVGLNLPTPIMLHDCAITRDYFIIMDINLEFQPKAMVTGGGLPFVFNRNRNARFGLLRRDATDAGDVQWFEVDKPLMIFHTANAWQEGPVVKLYACAFENFNLDLGSRPPKDSEEWQEYKQHMFEFEFNTANGTAHTRVLNDVVGDFPVVPASLVGRPCRYTYVAEMSIDTDLPKFTGVVKMDLTTGRVAGRVTFGKQCYGGEAVFVPAKDAAHEDDGYLMTFVTDESRPEALTSSMVVYDARTMAGEPVAVVTLPCRVPYGFHGLHVNERQLQGQRK